MTYLGDGIYKISRSTSRAYAGYLVYKCNNGKWTVNSFVDREKEGEHKTLSELKKSYFYLST